MNFLDVRGASEEERRLIREILSDTSVVTIATKPQLKLQPNQNHLQQSTQQQNHNQQQNFNRQQANQNQHTNNHNNLNQSQPHHHHHNLHQTQIQHHQQSLPQHTQLNHFHHPHQTQPSQVPYGTVFPGQIFHQPGYPPYTIIPHYGMPPIMPYVVQQPPPPQPPNSVVPPRQIAPHSVKPPSPTANPAPLPRATTHHGQYQMHEHYMNNNIPYQPHQPHQQHRVHHTQPQMQQSQQLKHHHQHHHQQSPPQQHKQQPQVKQQSHNIQSQQQQQQILTNNQENSIKPQVTSHHKKHQLDEQKLVSDNGDVIDGHASKSETIPDKQTSGISTLNSDTAVKPSVAENSNNTKSSSDKNAHEIQNSSDKSKNSDSAQQKSWASLFKRGERLADPSNGDLDNNTSGSNVSEDEESNVVTTKRKNHIDRVDKHATPSNGKKSQETIDRASDEMAQRLSQKINAINLKHSLPYLKPRGFINKGNGCYINATLQSLIACPPFYNLMKEIGDLKLHRRENSCTPILDSFAELFLNFPPVDVNKKTKTSSPQDQKLNINQLQAEAIEPRCIYNVLGQIKSECLKGAQEDAEEFLSFVLNGLHEEMIGLGEISPGHGDRTQNGHLSDGEDSNDDPANDENLWREVGPRNSSLPIRTAKVINTPIQEIFGGSLFSIRTAGKDKCGHRSPFFDLQLDISSDNVKSVYDAIKSFTAPEVIHDFYCSKTKQKLDAQRRTSLDQLPPILILHLKQFVYTQDHGLKKLMKKIEYPIDLELPETCLYERSSSDKNSKSSRSYKLLAVVYHDGKEAMKGHYFTDVFHIGSSLWIRCDDSNLKVISAPRIETPDSHKTPYLLFYRRLNTLLRAQIGNHDNKKKN